MFKVGEAVLINKWSHSLNPLEYYLPEHDIFPKQLSLFGDYCILGIILESTSAMCYVWIPEREERYYINCEDIKKCQD